MNEFHRGSKHYFDPVLKDKDAGETTGTTRDLSTLCPRVKGTMAVCLRALRCTALCGIQTGIGRHVACLQARELFDDIHIYV